MIKKLSMNNVFDRINEFNSKNSLDEQNLSEDLKRQIEHTYALTNSISSNGDERGFMMDPVQIVPGLNRTRSNLDPVQVEPPATDSEKETGFTVNPVHAEPCANQTGSIMDPVQNEPRQTKAHSKGFTAVPNELLRITGLFEDPLDFMLYLHFYTYSYGFGRDTASMGQTQLEKFAGVSRNRIRRSLERLESAKWIRVFSEFSAGQVTRSWKVTPPEKLLPDPSPKKTGSKLNPVHREPGSPRTPRGSNLDTPTGFTVNPYKERVSKKVLKKSLSQESFKISVLENLPNSLQKYFQGLIPRAKAESEWKAYLDLAQEFQNGEVENAFVWLRRNGMPDTGKPCHSPMAFLRIGMGQVIHQLKKAKSSFPKAIPVDAPNLDNSKIDGDFSNDLADLERRFPIHTERTNLVKKLTADIPGINPEGPFALHLAMSRLDSLKEAQSAQRSLDTIW